jgi:hypothetical protein
VAQTCISSGHPPGISSIGHSTLSPTLPHTSLTFFKTVLGSSCYEVGESCTIQHLHDFHYFVTLPYVFFQLYILCIMIIQISAGIPKILEPSVKCPTRMWCQLGSLHRPKPDSLLEMKRSGSRYSQFDSGPRREQGNCERKPGSFVVRHDNDLLWCDFETSTDSANVLSTVIFPKLLRLPLNLCDAVH